MKHRAAAPDLFSAAALLAPAQVAPPPTPEPPARIEAPPPAPVHADPHAATPDELNDAAFSAIAGAMRGWTIGWPGQQAGMSFATARHVRTVVQALRADGVLPGHPRPRPDARPLLRQILQAVLLGHVQLRPDMGVLGQREFDTWIQAARAATEGRDDAG